MRTDRGGNQQKYFVFVSRFFQVSALLLAYFFFWRLLHFCHACVFMWECFCDIFPPNICSEISVRQARRWCLCCNVSKRCTLNVIHCCCCLKWNDFGNFVKLQFRWIEKLFTSHLSRVQKLYNRTFTWVIGFISIFFPVLHCYYTAITLLLQYYTALHSM